MRKAQYTEGQDLAKSKAARPLKIMYAAAMLVALVIGMDWGGAVMAQAPSGRWSSPIVISDGAPPPPGMAHQAAVIASPDGFAHIFWNAITDASLINPSNIIYYLRVGSNLRAPPLDILYSGESAEVNLPSLVVDKRGNLHALWAGNYRDRLYYRSVAILDAGNAAAWKNAEVVAEGRNVAGKLAVDEEGNILVVYSLGNGNTLYFTRLAPGAQDWSPAVSLPGTEGQVGNLHAGLAGINAIAVDGAGRIHVTWSVWMGGSFSGHAFYTRSLDGGKNWSSPLRIDPTKGDQYGVDTVNIHTIGRDEVHLIWLGDALRRHQWSSDGGQTWSEPESFMGNVFGHNQIDAISVDSAGAMHVIAIGGKGGGAEDDVYHSTWTKGQWTDFEMIATGLHISGRTRYFEGPSAAITNGNTLHVVWYDTANIWYTSKRLDAQPIPSTPLATFTPTPLASPTASRPVTGTALPTATPSRTFRSDLALPEAGPISSSTLPIVAGLIPGLLVVAAMLILRSYHMRG